MVKDQETRGRYRLHTSRTTMKALPSADFFTGSLEGPFIDTDEDTDRGRIYISLKTFEDWAYLFGYVPNDLARTQAKVLHELENENRDLRNALELVRSAAAELLRVANRKDESETEQPAERVANRKSKDERRELESPQRALEPSPKPVNVAGLE